MAGVAETDRLVASISNITRQVGLRAEHIKELDVEISRCSTKVSSTLEKVFLGLEHVPIDTVQLLQEIEASMRQLSALINTIACKSSLVLFFQAGKLRSKLKDVLMELSCTVGQLTATAAVQHKGEMQSLTDHLQNVELNVLRCLAQQASDIRHALEQQQHQQCGQDHAIKGILASMLPYHLLTTLHDPATKELQKQLNEQHYLEDKSELRYLEQLMTALALVPAPATDDAPLATTTNPSRSVEDNSPPQSPPTPVQVIPTQLTAPSQHPAPSTWPAQPTTTPGPPPAPPAVPPATQAHKLAPTRHVTVVATDSAAPPEDLVLQYMLMSNTQGVAAVLSSTPVHRLRFNHIRLPVEAIRTLARALYSNSTLLHLEITHAQVTSEGAKAIAAALATNSTLQTLTMDNNGVGPEGARAFATALVVNSTLLGVSLEGNGVGAHGALALATALEGSSSVVRLNLDNNSIADQGAKALARSLITNRALQWMHLSGNGITAEGAQAIAMALSVNNTLQWLHLSSNQVGSEGAAALASALCRNRSLQHLALSDNHLGTQGAKAIAAALASDAVLQALSLRNNGIPTDGIRTLAQALDSNNTLMYLDLRRNPVGEEGALALSQALSANTTIRKVQLLAFDVGTPSFLWSGPKRITVE